MPAGMAARGAPLNTGTVVVGTGPVPKAGLPGRGVMTGGGTIGVTRGATVGCTTGVAGVRDAEAFPNESRKAVKSSFGSRGWGGTILMQVLGTFFKAHCMMEARLKLCHNCATWA